MPTNLIQSGQPVTGYKPSIFNAQPSRLTTPAFAEAETAHYLAWSTMLPLGFVILSTLPQTSQTNTDVYARATLARTSTCLNLTAPLFVPVPDESRYLTIEEQRVFHTALLRSARSIRKAKRANV